MKKLTPRLNDIIFVVGALLVLIQAFVASNMLQKGTLIFPQIVNLATFVYYLMFFLGYHFFGIIGVVMVIISLISMNKE